MHPATAIALGGAVGSVARYWAASAVYAWLGRDFPYGTMLVNVTGGLLMGFLTELLVTRYAVALEWRALVLVGFLGGYTTFSTFSMETWLLLNDGELAKAGLNALASVVLCVVAVWLGLNLARWGLDGNWNRWLSMESYGARLLMIGGVAYALGLLTASLGTRLAWPEQTQALLVLGFLALLAPCGAWYLPRSGGDASQMLLAFFYSTLLSSGGGWLGLWSGGRLTS